MNSISLFQYINGADMFQVREWLFRLLALLVAWGLVLAISALAGKLMGYRLWPTVVGWLWIGLVLMSFEPGDHPMPQGKDVDVVGALRMLWWATLWPKRLFHK